MNIVQVPVEALNPAEYNPRLATAADVEQLKASIAKFGMVDPIIVNSNPERNNIVIGGHFRLTVAKELGLKEVPVFYVNLNEADERELNIRLNKNVGRWDYDALGNNFDPDLLKDWGFTEMELGLGKQNFKDDVEKDKLGADMESYLEGNIRQIVLYFKKDEFEGIIKRMDAVMAETSVDSHTEAFLKLLQKYEDTRTSEKAD